MEMRDKNEIDDNRELRLKQIRKQELLELAPIGFLLVDKDSEMTSYDVIRKVKWQLPKNYKIGHAGTLDPFATGLLILMLGKATKKWSTLQGLTKTYEVMAEFGYETDTQDRDGEKTEIMEELRGIPKEEIEEAMKAFTGKFLQTPPAFSAKKVNGKRAYELAREGKEVKLEPREVNISKFEIIDYSWPKVSFKVEVSSGTYIRSLVVDLARSLESMATAVELRRTDIGDYSIDKAITMEDIKAGIDFDKSVLEVE
jgi:tRNA pseudouridine55 synthase